MAVKPLSIPKTAAPHLVPFDVRDAARVASWVVGATEAYWLAPQTRPPITAEKVVAWIQPGRHPYTVRDRLLHEPRAYGELNLLHGDRREFWLGHLIVDSRRRGQGWGTWLTRLLLNQAFRHHRARRVSLVVFPENVAAIACYLAAGMREDGYEMHYFRVYRRRERLLRLIATNPRASSNPA